MFLVLHPSTFWIPSGCWGSADPKYNMVETGFSWQKNGGDMETGKAAEPSREKTVLLLYLEDHPRTYCERLITMVIVVVP